MHFQKGNFTRNTLVMSNFDQNSQFLRKSHTHTHTPPPTHKNTFLPLFVQNGLKIDKNSENLF